MVSRAIAIQSLLDLFQEVAYLEIGVHKGETFRVLKAARKVAVDPAFLFNWKQDETSHVRHYEMTSDRYFGEAINRNERFSVIYLDGLHTFEQTLRDLINAASFLDIGGVIVIDDILPSSYAASLPDFPTTGAIKRLLKDPDTSWMGDVYKLAFFVETFFQQFSYATIMENHGQLVMWQQARPQVAQQSVEKITRMEFSDVVTQRSRFQIRPFADILSDVQNSIQERTRSIKAHTDTRAGGPPV